MDVVHFLIGSRVLVRDDRGALWPATVKHVGPAEFKNGRNIGVELDSDKANGTNGDGYFVCRKGCGKWVQRDWIRPLVKIPISVKLTDSGTGASAGRSSLVDNTDGLKQLSHVAETTKEQESNGNEHENRRPYQGNLMEASVNQFSESGGDVNEAPVPLARIQASFDDRANSTVHYSPVQRHRGDLSDSRVVSSLTNNLQKCIRSPVSVADEDKIFGLSHFKVSARQFQFFVEDLNCGCPIGFMKRSDMRNLVDNFKAAATDKGGLIVKLIDFHLEAPMVVIDGIVECRLTMVLDEVSLIPGNVEEQKKPLLPELPIPVSLLPKLQPGKEEFQADIATTVVKVRVQGRLVDYNPVNIDPQWKSFREAFLVDNTFNPSQPGRLRIVAFPLRQKDVCEQMAASVNLEVEIVGVLKKDPNPFNFTNKVNLIPESIELV